MYKFVRGHRLSFLLEIYLVVELLSHIASLSLYIAHFLISNISLSGHTSSLLIFLLPVHLLFKHIKIQFHFLLNYIISSNFIFLPTYPMAYYLNCSLDNPQITRLLFFLLLQNISPSFGLIQAFSAFKQLSGLISLKIPSF